MKSFAMLVRRELWEHRSLWMTPLVIAAVMILLVAIVGNVSWTGGPVPRGAFTIGVAGGAQATVWTALTFGLSVPFFLATSILVVVYLLDCLYAERRERSILFWRSLPVSDQATVLAKLTTGLIVTPLITYLVLTATVLVCSVLLRWRMGDALGIGEFFTLQPGNWFRTQIVLLMALVASVLWYAPYGAYLMMVSAWAKRSIFAWAFVPPVMLAMFEKLAFGTNYFGRVVLTGFRQLTTVLSRISQQLELTIGGFFRDGATRGGPGIAPGTAPGGGPGGMGAGGAGGGGRGLGLDQLDPSVIFDNRQLWIGLAIAAAMVWIAIWLRKRSEDS